MLVPVPDPVPDPVLDPDGVLITDKFKFFKLLNKLSLAFARSAFVTDGNIIIEGENDCDFFDVSSFNDITGGKGSEDSCAGDGAGVGVAEATTLATSACLSSPLQ